MSMHQLLSTRAQSQALGQHQALYTLSPAEAKGACLKRRLKAPRPGAPATPRFCTTNSVPRASDASQARVQSLPPPPLPVVERSSSHSGASRAEAAVMPVACSTRRGRTPE